MLQPPGMASEVVPSMLPMPVQDVDEDTRRFQAQSARLMGDMKEAGDAPFGGEVELDSKVRHFHPAPTCQAGGAIQKRN